MNQFAKYADFYDDMYQNKPYGQEVEKIEAFFEKHSKRKVKKILSLGCGTGTYEIILAQKGYLVTGVDLSSDMLRHAQEKIDHAKLNDKIKLIHSDIRKVDVSEKFDAVIMMFNIAGYLHQDGDLQAVIKVAKSHLEDGGIFLFDCWNEVAVVNDPPTDRSKTINKYGKNITRLTNGSIDLDKKLVKIKFTVIEEENGIKKESASEDHPMRYFSKETIKTVAKNSGMEVLDMTDFEDITLPASDNKWDMFVVLR